MQNGKDVYFVAVKVFLENDKGEFLITKDRFGCWDMPGGRLRPEDFDIPLEHVVERKLHEELGEDLQFRLGQPIVFMRHERDEIVAEGETEKRRIFAVGYTAQLESEHIMLGKNHVEHMWLDPHACTPELYLEGGWLRGAQEYIQQKQLL